MEGDHRNRESCFSVRVTSHGEIDVFAESVEQPFRLHVKLSQPVEHDRRVTNMGLFLLHEELGEERFTHFSPWRMSDTLAVLP